MINFPFKSKVHRNSKTWHQRFWVFKKVTQNRCPFAEFIAVDVGQHFNKKDLKLLNDYNIGELSKKIYKTNVMPSGASKSFVDLSETLINNLQKGADFDKIHRIISSELITNYGLDVTQDEVDNITEIVFEWYHK